MSAREDIAYVKGLLDAKAPEDATTAALLRAIVSSLSSIADEVDALRHELEEQQSAVSDLYSVCDELDADLADVERKLGIVDEDDDFTPFEEDYGEFACPECGLHFFCHSSMMEGNSAKCPDCGCVVTKDPDSDDDDK